MNLLRTIAVVIVALASVSVAQADTIEITLEGDVTLITIGSDKYNLDGARFLYVYEYSLSASPTGTDSGPDSGQPFSTSDFPLLSSSMFFTNRPNGANDAIVPISGADIEIYNWTGSPPPDRLNTADGWLLGEEFAGLVGPRTTLDLGSNSFFSSADPVTELPRLRGDLIFGADADVLTTNVSPAVQYDLFNVSVKYVRVFPVPESVTIDIKPGQTPSSINLTSGQKITVAIMTMETFDASQVDWETVSFGPNGATESHGRSHVEDVDLDGDMDVVLHFNTPDTGIECGDTEATLTGETFSGEAITGTDSIVTVNCD